MNKPQYLSSDGDFITAKQATRLLNLSEGKVMELAKEANATLKIGRCMRINKKKLYDYLNLVYSC